MKKLFFLLMLVTGMVTAQPNASNTQLFGKYLKFSKVPSGLNTDNVLVRGSDDIVKLVPRSSFGGGTLQSVLDAGNNAHNNLNINNYAGTKQVLLSNNGYLAVNDNEKQEYATLFPNYLAFSAYNGSTTNANYVGNWSIGNTGLVFNGRIRGTSGESIASTFNYPLISSPIVSTIPISVNGNYADTSGNISIPAAAPATLQAAFDGGTSIYGNGSIQFTGIGGTAGYQSNWTPYLIQFSDIDSNVKMEVNTSNISYRNDNVGSVNVLNITRTTAGTAGYSLPEKAEGNYTLTTLDDIDLKIPYTGAINDLEMGQHSIYVGNSIYVGIGDSSPSYVITRGTSGNSGFVAQLPGSKVTYSGESITSHLASPSKTKTIEFANAGYDDYVLQVPDKNGIIAVTSDIPKVGVIEPTSSTDAGTTGEIRVVSGYIYWCINTNTWIRAAGTTF